MKIETLSNSTKEMGRYWLITFGAWLFFSIGAYAQELTVTGKVTDSQDGSPLPGVSIVKKGTGIGGITDFDGNYSIKATKGTVLVFSFVGYRIKEVTVADATHDVVLAIDTKALDEVVVVGYGVQKKKVVTGAVASVKAEDITRVVSADLGNSIQGMVAGVNVTANSGQPGEGSSILIRGVSSITGDNTPLYVVDGVPQEGDPRLSPGEIASIDILKDAASCAIYGSRGAAGVILITTKQGKEGKMKVRATASYGVQSIRSGTPLMTASEQAYADMLLFRNRDGAYDDEMFLYTFNSRANFQNESVLADLVFRDLAPIQNYNFNLSGGTKGMTYSVTAGYYDRQGVITNSDFSRFNTRANINYKSDRFDFSANVGYSQEVMNRPAGWLIIQSIKYKPSMPLIDPNSSEDIHATSDHEATQTGWIMDSFQNEDEQKRNIAFGNFRLGYKIIDGLTLATQVGTRSDNIYRHRFNPFVAIYDQDGELRSNQLSTSNVIMNTSRNASLTWNTGFTYQKEFGNNNLTAYLGQTVEVYSYDNFQASKEGVNNNSIKDLDGAQATPEANSPNMNYVNKLIGQIGRVQYDYANKYLLNVSLRRDGSSKFSDENRWGYFPSASVGWNISEENFWSDFASTVNTFKIRASYGTVGNQNFTPYSYSPTVTDGLDYSFDGTSASYGYASARFANAQVKWETSIQTNFGIDLALFDNRVTLSAEYYQSRKKDMLTPVQLAPSAGVLPTTPTDADWESDVILNVGNMVNQGVELAASYRTAIGAAKLRLTGTFSTNMSEITNLRLADGSFIWTSDNGLVQGKTAYSRVAVFAEGYEPGAFFLYETAGVINTQEELDQISQIENNGSAMGDLIYVDQPTVDTDGDGVPDAGDGKIDNNDRKYMGSGLPEYEVGLNIGLDYRGFDLSMRWYSAIGHELMNGAKATAYGWGRHKDLLSQWSVSNPNSEIPAYIDEPGKDRNYNGDTDLWLEDGSFIRLKQITLGYTLPKRITQTIGIDGLRFYVSAQNPLTFTKYEGFDPEVGGNVNNKGLDKGNYPVTSMYTAGVNLNF